MKRFLSFVLSGIVTTVLVVSGASTVAWVDDVPLATVDLSGELSALADGGG